MSMMLMAKAMQIKIGNPLRKLVLIKLADNANDAGECWPSYNHIADQCEMSRRSAINHIEQLEKDGYLKKVVRKKSATENATNVYVLTLKSGGENPALGGGAGDSLGGAGDALGGAGDALGGGAGDALRTSHSFEPVIEPKKTKAKKVSNPDAKKPQPKTTAPLEKQSAKKPVQPLPIPQELADEIVAYRKLIKKPVTDRALRGIANDMLEAHRQTGLTLEQLVETMQVKGWMTVKAEWMLRLLDQAKREQHGLHSGYQTQPNQALTDIIWGWEQ
jgi:hypothetical protein